MKEKKQRQRRMTPLWLLGVALSRLLYLLLAQEMGIDTYGYGANAMAITGKEMPVLTSGLAYVYVQKLSVLLPFFRYDLIWVSVYQTVLQIVWLVLIFFGVSALWGKVAGYVTGTVLLISPWMLHSVKTIDPINFLLFHFSIILFLFGVFHARTVKKGWYRSNAGELFLIFVGFYMGVICIWNYISFLLLPVMIYVLVQNRSVLSERLWKQKNIELKESEQLMPIGSQGFILFAGMLVGMFATLMKYTGLTGNTVWEQLFLWQEQLAKLPGRCQDVSLLYSLWLVTAFVLGIGIQWIAAFVQRKRKEKLEYEAVLQKERENQQVENIKNKPENDKWDELADEKLKDGYFTTKDGRIVKYIENPLPGPKKHVKRELKFEIDDIGEKAQEADDFDYKIDESSDFDFD